MKFCCKFYQGCRALDEADEVMIKYNETNNHLVNFVSDSDDDIRIVANITELSEEELEESKKIFLDAYKAHPEFALMISKEQNIISYLSNMKIPFFFIEGANNWTDVRDYIALGVSDIYIQNELGFDLKAVAAVCHSDEYINIRVFPNIAQVSNSSEMTGIHKFFIRPDDVIFYENFVDIFEFYGPLDRQPVLFDIYKDERWLGKLNDVIIGLDNDIDNRTIMPVFGDCRIDCKQICAEGRCKVCKAIENVSKTLIDKEIVMNKRSARG